MTDKCKIEHPNPPKRGEIGPRVTHMSRMLRYAFNEIVCEEGLFAGQHYIILILKHNPGVTISRLADMLGITAATVSVSIKRMEKAGFIEKQADENDARITKLFLTEKGLTIPDKIKEKLDFQEQFITRGMSEEEVLLLSDLLDRAIENMKERDDFNA